MKKVFLRLFSNWLIPRFIFVSFIGSAVCAGALTISSAALQSASPNAPLAAVLQLTTDDSSRVSVTVGDGTRTWTRNFYDYDTVHSVPLLGFRPDTTNEITVTVRDRFGNSATTSEPFFFITAPLPGDFPKINLLKSEPKKMEPGYTLFRVVNINDRHGFFPLVNSSGEVVWYTSASGNGDIRQLQNGDLFFPTPGSFNELNMLGNAVNTWPAPAGYSINTHDGVPTDHGTIIYLSNASRSITNYPTSTTDPRAPRQTTAVQYQRVVEISATNSTLLNVWSLIDMLEPDRIDYLGLGPTSLGYDNEHANSLLEDPRDDSIIVSVRHQDAIIKFSRATGQLEWILGSHANWGPEWQKYLLTPVGTPFEWQYMQHGLMLTPWDDLLVFDNGDFRASPFDPPLADTNNYSRGVEYEINEQKMQVSQPWEYGRTSDERIYSDSQGNTDWLPELGNVLLTFASSAYVNGAHPNPYAPNARLSVIKEVTHGPNPEVVFEMALFDYTTTNPNYQGNWVYRAHRVPDLYPVVKATRAVADLITAVGNLGSRADRGLIAGLGAAAASIGENHLHTAVNQLYAFQSRIEAAHLDSGTAAQLIYQAQSVIDALGAGDTSYASELLTSRYPMFTPSHAIADLIETVGKSRVPVSWALVSHLADALTDLGENDTNAALRKLYDFQKLVQVTWMDPRLAAEFKYQSQRIISALRGSQNLRHGHWEMSLEHGRPVRRGLDRLKSDIHRDGASG